MTSAVPLDNGSRACSVFLSRIPRQTERVAPCKSRAEVGVPEALGECTRRYLGQILEAAGAMVVVVLGDRANAAVAARPIGMHGPVELGSRPRLLLCLPHPNARRERRVDRILPPNDLERVRGALR